VRAPHVTVHYAQSLDGRIATCTGDSQWIGGPASLRLAHQLRADHAAVLVGVGTVLADNPRLTVRLVEGPSPRRVVVDSRLRLPLATNLLVDGAAPTCVATTAAAPADRVAAVRELGADVLVVDPDEHGQVDLRRLLMCLAAEHGLHSVLIEGGGGVITSALRQGVVDRLVVCIAARLIGSGVSAVGDLGVTRLQEAPGFSDARFRLLEDDVIFEGQLAGRGAAD
jgi:5-amino-6-(5-phosphoribosylamino)uracil reductase/diaminohydroxyphosphoribosylaminopyrimidine deaminase/5-amino-6-(5-phosphoribosylamino)uracil reductase